MAGRNLGQTVGRQDVVVIQLEEHGSVGPIAELTLQGPDVPGHGPVFGDHGDAAVSGDGGGDPGAAVREE